MQEGQRICSSWDDDCDDDNDDEEKNNNSFDSNLVLVVSCAHSYYTIREEKQINRSEIVQFFAASLWSEPSLGEEKIKYKTRDGERERKTFSKLLASKVKESDWNFTYCIRLLFAWSFQFSFRIWHIKWYLRQKSLVSVNIYHI